MRRYVGRHVYGLAAVGFALIDFFWQQFNGWQQIRVLGNISHPEWLVFLAGAAELFGGLAIQWNRTARVGALTLTALYSAFALLWVPNILAQPGVYDPWGNFFEQSSLIAGGLIAFATIGRSSATSVPKLARIGYVFFGLSVVSFTLEQIFYFSATSSAVPKWIPPGQTFWAVTTTIALGLAAIALLSGRSAVLASQLLTVMIIGFGVLVWLPAVIRDPHKLFNWAANAQNLAIAGAAWIVADFLHEYRRRTDLAGYRPYGAVSDRSIDAALTDASGSPKHR